MHPRAAELISTLQLIAHPEDGFYRAIFRSTSQVVPDDGRGPRSALKTILCLLTPDGCSRGHRVRSDDDEVWARTIRARWPEVEGLI
jgi:predicted cupin superfamily sugar epimerase